MKTLYILLIFIFSINFFGYTQDNDYPILTVDSTGKQVVVFTIEQVQKIDNSLELLSLLEELNTSVSNIDTISIKVINEKSEIIKQQDLQISKLKEDILTKDSMLINLKGSIILKDSIIKNHENETILVDQQLKETKKEFKDLKKKMLFGGTLSSFAIIGLILIIIL